MMYFSLGVLPLPSALAGEDKVKVLMVPVPVPVFIPVPMNMYSQHTPVPMAMPLPVSPAAAVIKFRDRSESVLDKNVLRFYQVPVPVVVPPQKKEMKDAAVQLEVIEQPKGKEDAAREEMTDEAPNFSTGAHSFIITTTC